MIVTSIFQLLNFRELCLGNGKLTCSSAWVGVIQGCHRGGYQCRNVAHWMKCMLAGLTGILGEQPLIPKPPSVKFGSVYTWCTSTCMMFHFALWSLTFFSSRLYINTLFILSIFRIQLAAIHHNENCDRNQAMNEDGVPEFVLKYPKFKKGLPIVSRIMTQATYGESEISV